MFDLTAVPRLLVALGGMDHARPMILEIAFNSLAVVAGLIVM